MLRSYRRTPGERQPRFSYRSDVIYHRGRRGNHDEHDGIRVRTRTRRSRAS